MTKTTTLWNRWGLQTRGTLLGHADSAAPRFRCMPARLGSGMRWGAGLREYTAPTALERPAR